MRRAYHAAARVLPCGMGIFDWLSRRLEIRSPSRLARGPDDPWEKLRKEADRATWARADRDVCAAFNERIFTRELQRILDSWPGSGVLDVRGNEPYAHSQGALYGRGSREHLRWLAHEATGLPLDRFRIVTDPAEGRVRLWHDAGLSAEQVIAVLNACREHVPPSVELDVDCAPDQGGGGGTMDIMEGPDGEVVRVLDESAGRVVRVRCAAYPNATDVERYRDLSVFRHVNIPTWVDADGMLVDARWLPQGGGGGPNCDGGRPSA